MTLVLLTLLLAPQADPFKTLSDPVKRADVLARENALKEFKTTTARRVRDIVPQMTQSFDARRIESAYADREFTDDDQLSGEEKVRLQGVLSDEEPLTKKPALDDPSKYATDHLPGR